MLSSIEGDYMIGVHVETSVFEMRVCTCTSNVFIHLTAFDLFCAFMVDDIIYCEIVFWCEPENGG